MCILGVKFDTPKLMEGILVGLAIVWCFTLAHRDKPKYDFELNSNTITFVEPPNNCKLQARYVLNLCPTKKINLCPVETETETVTKTETVETEIVEITPEITGSIDGQNRLFSLSMLDKTKPIKDLRFYKDDKEMVEKIQLEESEKSLGLWTSIIVILGACGFLGGILRPPKDSG
jgi:hypothetical protein